MKKILMMLLGVAFAACAQADVVPTYITAYEKDTSPADANGSWYSCYFMDLDAIKAATGNTLSIVDCNAYAEWLEHNFADNKAATTSNASLVMTPFLTAYYGTYNQYGFQYEATGFEQSKAYLAVCFFDNDTDHAFKIAKDTNSVYSIDDQTCDGTGWIAAPAGPTLDPIEYLTWDEGAKAMVATNTTYEVVTKDTVFEDGKWYVVTNTIERYGITVNGEAHLILCDGASLKVTGAAAEAGINVGSGKSLTIYGQSEGTGKLDANGGFGAAGIGGNAKGTCGAITINGGMVKSTGGDYGAGIGCGEWNASAATITINAGEIEATGGQQGAGIGSGNYYGYGGSRSGTDVITINGGTITATGGQYGAGIGSGSDGLAATVTINGGTITASTKSAEAIGQGDDAKAATTVAFGEGVEVSIKAGDDEASATATTVADYVADHSAAYVKIEAGSSTPTQDPIEYLTWDEETKSLVATNTTSYTVVTKDTATFESNKWYVVTNTVERGTIKVNGEAHLILCDGASLTVTGADNEAGIEVPADKSLTIYGQSEGTGELKATGGEYGAGIGGNVKGTCGTMTINGGTITATGGYLGAGIGGGSRTVNAATITINGGNVEAIGGTQGAGIGSGNYYEYVGSRSGTDTITINGGTIQATGGKWGAGIGSGSDGFAATVTINGGSITASTVAGKGAEAIGQGDAAKAATTVTFAEGVEVSIKAGDDEASATATTVDDYTTDHSAAYVKISEPMPTVTVDEIIDGEDWTKFDVAYAIDNLKEGVDYKVIIDVTAGGVTKSITNATAIVNGSFTNTVDTVQLFGGKVFDGEAKVVLSLEAGGAVVSSSTEKTVSILPPPVEYLDWDAGTNALVAATNQTYEVVTAETATFEAGWYIVTNTIERGGIKVNGEAHLILCDGASLTVTGAGYEAGVEVAEGKSLTIYGQSEGTGTLDATGGAGAAGIGSSYDGTCGTITINGGTIAAISSGYGAGIGGSSWSDNGATITINGGTVKATGGKQGAGIGGGDYEDYTDFIGIRSSTDVITINGGEIEANGGLSAAGIGCGFNGFAATITINGGTIKATGGDYGAAIGSGEWNNSSVTITVNDGEIEAIGGLQGAGIGSGNYYFYESRSGTDVITINGGTIQAAGGQFAAGIGGGCSGFAATVTINGGTITASTTPNAGAEAIGSGYEPVSLTTVTFGTALASTYVWAGESATKAETMTTTAFATDHSAVYVELPVEIYTVAYDANGATGTMSNSVFAVAKEVSLKKNAFTALGYDFAGWTTNGTDVVYADEAKRTDFTTTNATLTLYAKWNVNTNGVTATSYETLTNAIATAGLQQSNLPITIDFTSNVKIEGATLPTLPTGTGFDGLKYVGDDEGGSNLELKDGVLYGSAMRGEVTVDALVLMQLANGGTISSFQAVSEGETTVTNAVVMLLGDDGKAYFNDTDDVDEMIADILAADPRPTTVKLYEVKGAMVTFEAMGGTLTNGLETVTYLCLPDTGYVLPDEVEREGYTLKGWFDSWKPGANEITNNQVIVDYAPQSLYAQWTSTAPTPKADELHISDVTNNVPVTEIAAKAYVNKTSVKTVTTPLYLKKICNRAFMGCTALEKLTITATRDYETLEPTKVTIEQNAFSGCTSLEELLIAGEIEKIGQSAFQNCAKLKKIIFRGDEAIAYDPGAFYRCGYANGTDELKVYMSSAFQAANAQLISDFRAWNTQVKIIDKIGVEPVTGETTVSIDPTSLVAGKRVAIVVQTSVKGTPDKEDVDIELSTDLATWTPITEGVEKTAYPDGTVMIEITVPNAPSAFFRAVVKEN